MTFMDHAWGGSAKSIFGGSGVCRVSLAIIVSVVLLVVVWLSPPSTFLSYSQLSASQIENFFNSPVSNRFSSTSSPKSNSSLALLPEEVVAENENLDALSPGNAPSIDGLEKLNGSKIDNLPVDGLDKFNESKIDDSTAVFEEQQVQEDQHLQNTTEENEKYLFPLLSFQVGTGNQLMEYKSAAVLARVLNRTLCLAPFFIGPGRHFGYLGNRHAGLYMEERYDVDYLSKLVKVASMEHCLQKCNRKLDAHWRLRNTGRPPQWESWFKANDTPKVSTDFDRQSPKWSSTGDVAWALGPRNTPKCLAVGGMFPGLRWRGVFYAGSAYMKHSKVVMKATNVFQQKATGSDPFLSVHWRFEESNCRGHPLGLCFSRCADGAVIANGHKSERWGNMTREGRKDRTKTGFNGVSVPMEDISGAISDRALHEGLNSVYLSSDGWLRGAESTDILRWVVEDLRKKGLRVSGLWQIPGLSNFIDGTFVHHENIAELFGLDKKEKVSNPMIALVEQEMCIRSAVFMGSGQSSWSLAVADTRRGRKCQLSLEEKFKNDLKTKEPKAVENEVIDSILSIKYTAGPTCRGSWNAVPQSPDDEAPDSWLDYEACEERLDRGGRCTRIST